MRGAALTPAWLASQGETPAALPAALPLAQLFALPGEPVNFQPGTCIAPGLEIAGGTPSSVVQGDATTFYTFTTIITNTGLPAPTGALTLTLNAPAAFYFVGNSATARSQFAGSLAVEQPLLNTAAGAPAVLIVRAVPASSTLPVGDVIDVSYRLAAVTGGAPNPTLDTTATVSEGVQVCSVSQAVMTSQCPPAVRTPLQLTIPPYLVSRGNTAGDIYTFTVRNTGSLTATDVSFEIDPSPGFFFKASSATASNQSAPLTLQQPLADTLSGSPFVLTVADLFPANTLAPSGAITVVLRLGTDGDAKSGQPLSVTLRSGATVPQLCSSTRANISTGRGNLVITKLPDVQTARLGDVVTWTVSLRNTGLGSVYDAAVAEAPGSGIRLLSVTPAATTTAEIKPDQSVRYTVTAQISACSDLRNSALGVWSIGNIDASGLVTNPVTDDAYLSYRFEDPAVSVSVEPLGDLAFCGPLSRTVEVTVTNAGGPARDLVLELEQIGSFTLTALSTDWQQVGSSLTYTGNDGILPGGSTITFSLSLQSTGSVCAADNGSFVLRPAFRAACPLGDPPANGSATAVTLQSTTAPSLTIQKEASTNLAAPGDTIYYTVTVSGRNLITAPIGPIRITDTLPAIFGGGVIVRSDSGDATNVADDLAIETVITPTSTPFYTESLLISATIPLSGVCGFGATQTNRTGAYAQSCPECLQDSAAHDLFMADPGPNGGGYFRLSSQQIAVCGPTATQQTAAISITEGITWAGSRYIDGLNSTGTVGPLSVISGSVRLLVDEIDRTADVTITTDPVLRIELDNIGSVSQTAQITITYQVTAQPYTGTGDQVYFVRFIQGGYTNPFACGVTRYAPVGLSVQRAWLGNLNVDPYVIKACTTNTVKLTVNGGDLEAGVTDQIVVTFTADISDVLTTTAPSLVMGGGFAGEEPVVTTGTLGSRQLVTFTFRSDLDLDAAGTISFPLYRPCGVTALLGTSLSYADACRVTKTAEMSGGLFTQQSNLLLRVPQITYTLDTDSFTWQFSVRNAGNMTASNVLVTNTLPYGISYRSVVRSGVDAAYLSAITVVTGTVDGREVVSFTVPNFPANSSIQFIGSGVVDSCNSSDSLWIRLTQPCGGVGNTCGGSQMERIGVQQGAGALLTSNTQLATIPLCSSGNVRLVVKNASGQTDLFNFIVQQVLTDVTYVDGSAQVQLVRANGTISPFVPFTPTSIVPETPHTTLWSDAGLECGGDGQLPARSTRTIGCPRVRRPVDHRFSGAHLLCCLQSKRAWASAGHQCLPDPL
jgi:uncharacterized repeat protein (TIGR01451 family)